MKVPAGIKNCDFAWFFRVSAVVIATCILTGGIQAAQRKSETEDKQTDKKEDKQTHKKEDAQKAKAGNLVIEVLVFDRSNKEQPPVAAERAMVRIQGGKDAQETDAQGHAVITGIGAGKAVLQVFVIGVQKCPLPITITGGDQTIRVLVDKSQSKCEIAK
jgi:hypothetical protein